MRHILPPISSARARRDGGKEARADEMGGPFSAPPPPSLLPPPPSLSRSRSRYRYRYHYRSRSLALFLSFSLPLPLLLLSSHLSHSFILSLVLSLVHSLRALPGLLSLPPSLSFSLPVPLLLSLTHSLTLLCVQLGLVTQSLLGLYRSVRAQAQVCPHKHWHIHRHMCAQRIDPTHASECLRVSILYTCTQTRARARARAQACTRTRTLTHVHTHTPGRGGRRKGRRKGVTGCLVTVQAHTMLLQ